MSTYMEQRRIKLADVASCGAAGFFTRQADETLDAFRARLAGAATNWEGKVPRYMIAMEQGASFPPVVLTQHGKNLTLQDGFHRCAAAAMLLENDLSGQDRIHAIVYRVNSEQEAELVSGLAYDYSEAGMPWAAAARLIDRALMALRERAVTACERAPVVSLDGYRTRKMQELCA